MRRIHTDSVSRSVRTSLALWTRAKRKAATEDPPRTVNDVLNRALERYVEQS